MLDKFNCIKPTRLWHHTSYKAFKAAIKDRYDAVKNLDARFVPSGIPGEVLKTAALVWTSALAIFYSYGMFHPDKIIESILPPPCDMETNANKDVCNRDEKKVVKKVPSCPEPKKPCK